MFFHLSKLWRTKFFILWDLMFLVRLHRKLEIDHFVCPFCYHSLQPVVGILKLQWGEGQGNWYLPQQEQSPLCTVDGHLTDQLICRYQQIWSQLLKVDHVQYSTFQYSTVQCSGTVRCSLAQSSTIQCSTVQCSTVQWQCSTVQNSKVQCSGWSLQHSAVQCSTVRYSL